MYWQKWSDRLRKELKLEMDPVAMTFGGALAPGIPAPQAKLSVCQALKRAAEGEPVTITAETCGCPGGLIGQPASLHHLVSLAGYWEGGSIKPELSGPACRTGVAYPAVTGQIGLSLLDFGARRLAAFPKEHLLLSVPLHRMMAILAALDEGVGRAGVEEGESIERQIEELGKVEPSRDPGI